MFRKILISIFSISALFSASVFAVGLGEIKQSSGLNQPLNASIPLLSAGDLAEYEVVASLASNKEFEKVGVERLFFLNNIKFETTRDSNDQIVIKVSTFKPVKEPFLNFVVELNWPNGRILREYTLLLDPPVFEENTASTIDKASSEPPVTTSSSSVNQTAESSTPRSSYRAQENYQSESNSQPSYSGSTYGPVSSTDTLWSIASRVRPDRSVSIQQTLVAIYRANPDAFSNGNINNLLKGKVLNIPDSSTIANVPQRAALQDVVMQNRQWRTGGARKIVDTSGADNSSTNSGDSGSRLRLGADNSQEDASGYGSDSAEIENIRNQLTRSQEESATLQAENEALRARLADILDKAENKDDSAVQVEDTELAVLGQNAEDSKTESTDNMNASDADDANESMTEAADEEDSKQNSDNSDSQLSSTGSEKVGKTGEPAKENVVQANSEQVGQEQNKTENQATPPSIFKPKQEKGLFDQILDNGMMLWGGIGVLVVIILMIVFWRMKKRMEDDEFQDDLVASAGAGSMDTTETFELPDVGDDMLVELDMDDEESQHGENIDESFDPIGEADIYIAYGKHEQAENLLLEAIEDNPVRADLKVKLMECYAESDDQDKFEALASEVSEAVDADEWKDQVEEMRAQAWGVTDEVESNSESEDDDFDLPSTEDIFGEEDDVLDVDFDEDDSDSNEAPTTDIDDVDADEIDSDDIDSLDDLDDIDGLDDLGDMDEIGDIEGLDDLDKAENDSFETETFDELDIGDDSLEGDSDELLDIGDDDFSIDMEDDASDTLEGDDDVSLDMDTDFNFDDESDDEMDFENNIGDDGDEIATKLDLARAYVDMGDADGAKEILREVVAEGNDEQKAEAQELLDKAD